MALLFSWKNLTALLALLNLQWTASAMSSASSDFSAFEPLDRNLRRKLGLIMEPEDSDGGVGTMDPLWRREDDSLGERPELYLIIAEAADDERDGEASAAIEDGPPGVRERRQPPLSRWDAASKRSSKLSAGRQGVEEERDVDDLETAAGTNVLRPLFVYRQQLAYRERVKKGALRRVGIRPRF